MQSEDSAPFAGKEDGAAWCRFTTGPSERAGGGDKSSLAAGPRGMVGCKHTASSAIIAIADSSPLGNGQTAPRRRFHGRAICRTRSGALPARSLPGAWPCLQWNHRGGAPFSCPGAFLSHHQGQKTFTMSQEKAEPGLPVEQQECATRTVYKYMSFDVALDVIANCWFQISRINALNDPFEWRFQRSSSMPEALFLAQQEQLVSDLNQKFGILCFSSVFDSILMWSHYADSHRGIVLGVKVPELQEVAYTGLMSLDEIKSSVEDTTWEISRKNALFFLRKRPEWSYEKELRRVFFICRGMKRTPGVEGHHERVFKAKMFGNKITLLGNEKSEQIYYYWRFKKPTLKSVYFGTACSKQQRRLFCQQLRNYN